VNLQIKAICEIANFLRNEHIPYVIIGGIAVQHWGEPRFTRDIDVTILVNVGEEERVINKIFSKFAPRIQNALEIALKHRVCLVKSSDGYEIDISLGIPGYEEELIKRAVMCDLKVCKVNICSAEDLIIHKAVAGRPQDCADIKGIILRRGDLLDVDYIRSWLTQFSLALEEKEVLERFERPWREIKGL